jgi:GntR family transcriptional regulator
LEAAVELHVNTSSRLPIYQQLGSQIREAIARGELKPEDKLPSVRELSRELVVNPNTIARAYLELERAGFVVTRPGLGVFVNHAQADLTREARNRLLGSLVDQLLIEAVHLGVSADEMQQLVEQRAKQFHWKPIEPKS